MKDLLRLVRWPNLLMVGVTLYLMRFVVMPAFASDLGMEQGLSELYYALMVIATILITAGGYIINDIRDLEMDKINRPRKYILQRKISVENARLYYYICNSAATLLISVVCIVNGIYGLMLIHLAAIFLLWLYSTSLKCKAIIGNVLTAFLSSLIPVVGFLYYILPSEQMSMQDAPYFLWLIIISYTAFSFLITWVREIFKDLEDRDGDRKNNCKTMAITWKLKPIKRLSYVLSALALLIILNMIRALLESPHYLFGATLTSIVVIILFELIPQIVKSRKKMHYKRISATCKILMAGGLLLLLMLNF